MDESELASHHDGDSVRVILSWIASTFVEEGNHAILPSCGLAITTGAIIARQRVPTRKLKSKIREKKVCGWPWRSAGSNSTTLIVWMYGW